MAGQRMRAAIHRSPSPNVDAQLMKNGGASLSRVEELAREGRFDCLRVESTGI